MLREYSEKQLFDELKRRRELRRARPTKLPRILLDGLMARCDEYMNALENYSEDADVDGQHYIFEAAIEAFYGKAAWDWINSRMNIDG